MSEPFLQFDGIDKAFQGIQVLKGISFSVLEGSMVGLVGENGAGKSTLMNILGGECSAGRRAHPALREGLFAERPTGCSRAANRVYSSGTKSVPESEHR